MKKFLLSIFLSIILCPLFFLLSGCQNEVKKIDSIDDLKNARIGVWASSAYELKAREFLPNANYVYLNFISDLVGNLLNHKIDAFVIGKSSAENIKSTGIAIDYLPQNLGDLPVAYIFPKNDRGQKICNEMNEFLLKIEASGELDALKNKWFNSDESNRTFEKTPSTGEHGTLKICTNGEEAPFIYLREGQLVGYELELFDKFCAAYGYNYESKIDLFPTMLIDVTTGKADVGMNAMEKTPEREDKVLFSNQTFVEQAVAVINSKSGSGGLNVADRIKASLIDENRWQMIVEGTFTTLFITIASIIFGTLLGLGTYLVYREKNWLINKIIDVIYRTLQGVPTMVLLLLFYYAVFGSVSIHSNVVAVIVFSIVLSVAVFIMLKGGTESISVGQLEAALALGFSERRAFIKFILPQVIRNYFATYQLNLNIIMLETAIVGYISVQDLTRVADMIRARTYDAFIPIITIALVYFLLSKILFSVTDIIACKINPKNRSREKILDGVKL